MDAEDQVPQRVKECYRDALMVAECAAAPNLLLVLFAKKDEAKMHRAMQDFEERHGQAVPPNLLQTNQVVGFWLPCRVVDARDPQAPLEGPTYDAFWLRHRVKHAVLECLKTHDIAALQQGLPRAVLCALQARSHSLN